MTVAKWRALRLTHNGLQIGDVADFGAVNCQVTTNGY